MGMAVTSAIGVITSSSLTTTAFTAPMATSTASLGRAKVVAHIFLHHPHVLHHCLHECCVWIHLRNHGIHLRLCLNWTHYLWQMGWRVYIPVLCIFFCYPEAVHIFSTISLALRNPSSSIVVSVSHNYWWACLKCAIKLIRVLSSIG